MPFIVNKPGFLKIYIKKIALYFIICVFNIYLDFYVDLFHVLATADYVRVLSIL